MPPSLFAELAQESCPQSVSWTSDVGDVAEPVNWARGGGAIMLLLPRDEVEDRTVCEPARRLSDVPILSRGERGGEGWCGFWL